MINNNLVFLQPTPRLRRLILLRNISGDPEVSQQNLAEAAGIAVSMANNYIKELEEEGLIYKSGPNPRMMQYHLTDKGKAYLKDLTLTYAKETIELYKEVKNSVGEFFRVLENSGVRRVAFYCAGEAAEVAVHALESTKLELVGVIDDDVAKQGSDFYGYRVQSFEDMLNQEIDALVVTTYDYLKEVLKKSEAFKKKGTKVVHL